MRLQVEQPHTNRFIYYRIGVVAFDPKIESTSPVSRRFAKVPLLK